MLHDTKNSRRQRSCNRWIIVAALCNKYLVVSSCKLWHLDVDAIVLSSNEHLEGAEVALIRPQFLVGESTALYN